MKDSVVQGNIFQHSKSSKDRSTSIKMKGVEDSSARTPIEMGKLKLQLWWDMVIGGITNRHQYYAQLNQNKVDTTKSSYNR